MTVTTGGIAAGNFGGGPAGKAKKTDTVGPKPAPKFPTVSTGRTSCSKSRGGVNRGKLGKRGR